MKWNERVLNFIQQLQPPQVPPPYEVLYPFADADVLQACRQFYKKYYADAAPRYIMIGINPGRLGAGITGVPFTDPIRLIDSCGIANPWPRKPELSSIFMYEMMEAFGGVAAFYQQLYISSISPLGFVADGKNVNYYDDRLLAEAVLPFAQQCLDTQLSWPVQRSVAFCIGEGKNLQYLQQLNQQHQWFNQIEALPHPRFVMQYKRTQIDAYIDQYLQAFSRHGIAAS